MSTVAGIARDSAGAALGSPARDIRLWQNGIDRGIVATDTGTGAYSHTITLSDNDIIHVHFDGETEIGVTITIASASDVSALDVRDDRIIIANDKAATISISDLANADSGDDSDIPFTVTAGALSTVAGRTVEIRATDTFEPNGNTTIGTSSSISDLRLAGTWKETGSEVLDLVRTVLDATGGTFTPATGTLKCSGEGNVSVWIGGGITVYDFELDLNSIRTLILSGDLIANNDVILTSGNLDNSGSANLEFKNNCTVAAAVGDNNDSTHELNVKATGTGAQTLTVTAGGVLPSFEISKGGGTLTASGTIAFNFNFTLTSAKSTVDMTTNSTILKSKGGLCIITGNDIDLHRLEVNHINTGSQRLTITNIVNVADLTALVNDDINQGTSGNLKLSGDVTVAATFGQIGTDNDALITLVGSATQTITITAGGILSVTSLDKTNATDVVIITGSDLLTQGDFTLEKGTLQFDGVGFDMGDDVFIKGAGVSTLEFIGTGSITADWGTGGTSAADTIILNKSSGVTTFVEDVTVDVFQVNDGDTIRGTVAMTLIVNEALLLIGTLGSNAFLDSTSAGTDWDLDVAAAAFTLIKFATVKDINALGQSLRAAGSTDVSGNTSWFFGDGIDGTLFDSDGTTPLTVAALGVSLRLNAGAATSDESYIATGQYQIVVAAIAATDILSLYIDTEFEKAMVISELDGSSVLSGVDLIELRIRIRHDNGGSLTIVDLGVFDEDDDATNFRYTANAGVFDVDPGHVVEVVSGHSFAPGGDTLINTSALSKLFVFGTWIAADGEDIDARCSVVDFSGTYTRALTDRLILRDTTGAGGDNTDMTSGGNIFSQGFFTSAQQADTFTLLDDWTFAAKTTYVKGTLKGAGRTLFVQGDAELQDNISAAADADRPTIEINGTGSQTINGIGTGLGTWPNIKLNKASGAFSFTGIGLVCAGNWEFVAATVVPTMTGIVIQFNPSGTSATVTLNADGMTFDTIRLDTGQSADTIQLTSNLQVATMDMDRGTLDVNGKTITVTVDWDDTGVNTTVNNTATSTLILAGTGAQNILPEALWTWSAINVTNATGVVTFDTFGFTTATFTCVAGSSFVFEISTTYTVSAGGTLTLLGTEASPVLYRSSVAATKTIFTLGAGVVQDVRWTDAKDIDSSGGDQVDDVGGKDSLNNDNWDFGPIQLMIMMAG